MRLRRVILPATIPLAALILLAVVNVPLGQPDYLIYRYSELWLVRLMRAVPAAAICCGMIWALGEGRVTMADSGLRIRVFWLGAAGLTAWSWFSPPQHLLQHMFNLNSPSHDGAFVWEANEVQDVRTYVSTTFYERLTRDVEQMRGTRVLSNPPGATLIAYAFQRMIADHPSWRRTADRVLDWAADEEYPSGPSASRGRTRATEDETGWPDDFRTAVFFGVFLTLMWGLAWPLAYATARLYLPIVESLLMATACVWNPATLNFTPGKDPAQLLTVLMVLYPALRGFLKKSWGWSLVGGLALVVSLTVGLIHAWIAGILVAATFASAWRVKRRPGEWVRISLLPACGGSILGLAGLYVGLDWNLLKSCVAVALRYPQIQQHLREGWYTFVGFPVFLLFAGPTFWVLGCAGWRTWLTAGRRFTRRAERNLSQGPGMAMDEVSALGRSMTVIAVLCMTYCYFFANNNEVARLWMPFLVLLTISLSMMLREDLMVVEGTVHGGVAALAAAPAGVRRMDRRMAAVLLALQFGVTLVHWSLMDARESEWRLRTGLNWG